MRFPTRLLTSAHVICATLAACGFPRPAEHAPDAGVDAPPGGPSLLAIEPAIANTGDTIALEGTFAPGAIVTFPGGATASATVLGTNRATAVVPSGATAGALTVSGTAGQVAFRRASFGLGLQPFRETEAQATAGRELPSLPTPMVGHASVVVGNGLYVFGNIATGAPSAAVLRATIDADGSLEPFVTVGGVALASPRGESAAVVAGGYVYVLGGLVGGQGVSASVERAPIAADGTLGTFAPAGQLAQAVTAMQAVVVGSTLYVIGGRTSSDDLGATAVVATVQRATIQPDGTLGAFAIDPDTALVTAREHAALAVVGGELYAIGGSDVGGRFSPLASIESAAIAGDGTLGAFHTAPAALATPRSRHAAVVAGGTLYAIGGFGGGSGVGTTTNLVSIEAAPIRSDGALGAFAAAGTLPTARTRASLAMVGDRTYLIGGYSTGDGGGQLATVAVASIDASGTLAASAATSTKLTTTRVTSSAGVVGDFLYVVGGGDLSHSVIERAPIAADGSLGAFVGVSSTLAPIGLAATAVIGGRFYVFGGSALAGFTTVVQSAPINGDGTLGAFVAAPSMGVARAQFAVAVIGASVYAIGGYNGSYLSSVERAPINADGTLGAFATVSGVTLTAGRTAYVLAVTGNAVYVVGGDSPGGHVGTVERAPIANGSLGTFATVGGVALTTPRMLATGVVLGSSLYVLGGRNGSNTRLASIESAPIAADGTLGAFTTSTAVLTAPHDDAVSVVVGNSTFTLGGSDGTNGYDTVEAAPIQ
jgi:hypothetical protein